MAPCQEPGSRLQGQVASDYRFGFTLLELLVTLAIIAILASQLLAALSQAKGKSQATVCRSNLRQLGIGLHLYLDESAGAYPYTASLPAANRRGTAYWFDAVGPTIPNGKWGEGVFKCPLYQGVVFEGESKRNSRGELMGVYSPCGSYAYNAAGRRNATAGLSGPRSAGLGFSVYSGQAVEPPVREGDVKAPADLYVFGDAPLSTAPWGTVATLRLGGAADYNSFVAENATVEKVQHLVAFNMLLADLHVERVKTNILLGAEACHRSRWNHDNQP